MSSAIYDYDQEEARDIAMQFRRQGARLKTRTGRLENLQHARSLVAYYINDPAARPAYYGAIEALIAAELARLSETTKEAA